MGNWNWKAKQYARKLVPISIAAIIIYGGYSLYKKHVFRHGLKPAIGMMLHKLPYFGSRFRHYGMESHSYTYSGHRGHHARLHRGHRRRHRRHRR